MQIETDKAGRPGKSIMRARVYLCLPQSKMKVSSLSPSFRPVCDVEDKLGPALPLCTTSHINSIKENSLNL